MNNIIKLLFHSQKYLKIRENIKMKVIIFQITKNRITYPRRLYNCRNCGDINSACYITYDLRKCVNCTKFDDKHGIILCGKCGNSFHIYLTISIYKQIGRGKTDVWRICLDCI